MGLVLKVKDKTGFQDCKRQYPTDAAFDVRAAVPAFISPHKWKLISTGLFFDIPPGYEIQVRSRSGLAVTKGIMVLNSPGTIDENYVDEVKVILMNHKDEVFAIERKDRIAQFVLSEIPRYDIEFVKKIVKESRGGGFGHSGVK